RAAASDAWARASSHRPTPPRLARYEFGLTKPAQPSNGCVGLSGGPCLLGSGSGPFIKPPDSGRAPMSNVLFPPSTDIRNVRLRPKADLGPSVPERTRTFRSSFVM